ncbi:MAG: GNAT family N-acetyltransferase [Rickettsiales bacterium]|nr:GNAT family N-acetyltransferase [Rickettsiales bacterium]
MSDSNTGFPPIVAGNLTVRLAIDEAEITASQKLRYRIFCLEMGGKASAVIQQQERDFDEFDQYCDHLLVIDSDKSGEEAVVGTYRLLRKSVMEKLGRFYTESEYDVSAVKRIEGEIMELGRSCVDAAYRNRAVMTLLWRGIGAYVTLHGVKLMFGCASFTGADPEEHKLSLSYLYHNHLAPEAIRLTALPDLYVDMNLIPKDQIDLRQALNGMPALIKGYLRLNGYVGDGAVIDNAYNTTDVGIMVQTDMVADKYSQRYTPEEAG